MLRTRISIRHLSMPRSLSAEQERLRQIKYGFNERKKFIKAKKSSEMDIHGMDYRNQDFIQYWRKRMFREVGTVPTIKKEFDRLRRKLENRDQEGEKFKDYQELLEIFRDTVKEQEGRRNLQMIAKINMGKINFIITQDLCQYVQIGDVIYDLNTRFHEFGRRIHDYCLVKQYIDDTPELGLFIDLLDFKFSKLHENDINKSAAQARETFAVHLTLDKVCEIETQLLEAVEKFKVQNPEAVHDFLKQSPHTSRSHIDFSELPDSKLVRRRLKGLPTTNTELLKHVISDAKEFLKDHALQDNEEVMLGQEIS